MESRVDRDRRPQQVDLARLVAVVRRRPFALVAGTLAAVALVATLGSQGRQYEAEATFLVGPIGGQYSQLRAAEQQAQTYAVLATSGDVLSGARARLPGAPAIAQLRAVVTASADFSTRLLTVSATSGRRAKAQATAAAVGAELQRVARARIPSGGSQLTIVQPARIGARTGGTTKTLVVIAGFTGLLATLAVLVALELDRPRRGPRRRLVSRLA